MDYKQVHRKNGEVIVFCNFQDLLKNFYETDNMEEISTHVNSLGEYIIHCPFCKKEGHTKHKLYIKSDLTVGHCFVCGRAFVNITDEVKVNYKIPEFFPSLTKTQGVKLATLNDPIWTLDRYYNEFDDFDQNGYNYLINRNKYLSELYKILGFKFWDGNIVMPFFYNGTPFYYQIRFIGGDSNIRYFFPPIENKPCYVINHGDNKRLILCEGIFDCISLLIQAPSFTPIALLGSSLSDYQLNMIREYVPDEVYIMMDEFEISKKIARKLREGIDYCPIKIIKTYGPDPEEILNNRIKKGKCLQWIK